MSSQSRNHVRSFRRRFSLAQQDLAFLLGSKSAAKVCRYEQAHRIPSLRNALRLAAIFNTTVGTLFSALQRDAYKDVAERIAQLHSVLEHRYAHGRLTPSLSRQLRWLEDSLGRMRGDPHQPT